MGLNYSERTERRNQLKSMPGWKVHWACSRFVSSFEIFRRNSTELLRFLENPPPISFEFLPDEKARLQKIESNTEMLRLLLNYVASAITLREHCYRIRDKYLQKNSESEYAKLARKEFTEPRARIIQQLRTFVLHVDLPAVRHQVKWMEGSNRMALLPDRLLEWEEWDRSVKDYLRSLTDQDHLFLDELVIEYNQKAHRFSEWFLNEIVKCNFDDLKDIYRIHDEILKSVRKDDLETDPLIVQFFTREFRLSGPL
jgi:hypothetical protein